MQVYRDMDIGTAKASPSMQEQVTHHMLDLVDPEHDYSVAEFQRDGRRVLDDLERRAAPGFVCGGSGLHFRSLVDPLEFPPSDPALRAELDGIEPGEARSRLLIVDPDAGDHVDLDNPRRVARALEIAKLTGLTPSQRAATAEAAAVRAYKPVRGFTAIGVDPGPTLADRVEQRFKRMLDAGLLDEVASLRSRLGRVAAQAVGYKELLPVVAGEADLAEGTAAAIRATMALAKRQRTFFRRDPRIHWIPWDPAADVRVKSAVEHLDEVAAWSS